MTHGSVPSHAAHDAEAVPMHIPVTAADAPIEMKGIRLAGAPLYLDMQVLCCNCCAPVPTACWHSVKWYLPDRTGII